MLGNVSCHLQVNVCRFSCLNLSWRVTDLEKIIQAFISNSCHSLGCSIYPSRDWLITQSVVRQLLNFSQLQCYGTAFPSQLSNSPFYPWGHFCEGRFAPQQKAVHFGLGWPVSLMRIRHLQHTSSACPCLSLLLRRWIQGAVVGGTLWPPGTVNERAGGGSHTKLPLSHISVFSIHWGSTASWGTPRLSHSSWAATAVSVCSAMHRVIFLVLGLPLDVAPSYASAPGGWSSSSVHLSCFSSLLTAGNGKLSFVFLEGCANAEEAACWDQLTCTTQHRSGLGQPLPSLAQIQAASTPSE